MNNVKSHIFNFTLMRSSNFITSPGYLFYQFKRYFYVFYFYLRVVSIICYNGIIKFRRHRLYCKLEVKLN